MLDCAQLHSDIGKEIGVKLDSKHWYDHVSKSVGTSHEGGDTVLWKSTSSNRQNHS